MSHLTQMLGLAVQNFVSAAAGMAVVVAIIRGITRRGAPHLGNFWVDLTRTIVRILLPLASCSPSCCVAGRRPELRAATPRPRPLDADDAEVVEQFIPGGPFASQEAIKQLGTNGGGFFNANSAHPFENPNGITNILEIYALLLIPFAFVVHVRRTSSRTSARPACCSP